MDDERRWILVVDDEFAIRDTLTGVLAQEGYEVVCAGNGQEALERLRESAPPAVILLDLMMPNMSGEQFRETQLADPLLASIPVVLLTADPSVRSKARNVAAEGYLAKPFSLDDLLAVVRRYL